MEIITKYRVGQTIYLGLNLERIGLNIIEMVVIKRIKITVDTDGKIEILYDTQTPFKNCYLNDVLEKFCFDTKEQAEDFLKEQEKIRGQE